MQHPRSFLSPRLWLVLAAMGLCPLPGHALDLADSPLFSGTSVPGNLILALSVEWPTATTPAYPSTVAYSPDSTFLGYFDPGKCYLYVPVNTGTASSPDYSTSYFQPKGLASSHQCRSSASTSLWSGNYLNWASMQTLDGFRWVLTGGYRSVDTPSTTILSKTYAAIDQPTVIPEKTVQATALAGATPFSAAAWSSGAITRIRNLGTRLWISGGIPYNGTAPDGLTAGSSTSGAVPYTGQNSYAAAWGAQYAKPNLTYELFINVKVCDKQAMPEANCVSYGNGSKPEGLIQHYAPQLRYSVFGYYNHSGDATQQRDGGVMRARMKYVGPQQPVPGSQPIGNAHAEWDPATGVMLRNPDPDDAQATQSLAASAGWNVPVVDSGVMNYLNKFGYFSKSYKSKDPVSELYYAALRYYRNLGNVTSYSSLANAGSSDTAAHWLDGFPAITSDSVWKKSPSSTDASYGSPILYACQRNFVLGIGDVNTHRDANLPSSTLRSALEPSVPPEVQADTEVNVAKATDMVGQLEGLNGGSLGSIYGDSNSGSCSSNSQECDTYYIAGLAYDAHTRDLRKDLPGTQTVSTYWMDVLERQIYRHKNQYWLASKYGGFDVPANFSPYATSNGPTTLDDRSWYNTADTMAIGAGSLSYTTDQGGADKRPDNYFPGDRPDTMKSGLTQAFADIVSAANASAAATLATASPNVAGSGNISYAAEYNPKDWTGQLIATQLSYATDGTPSATALWDARDVLQTMVTATDTSARKIVTCCTAAGAALPFTAAALSGSPLSPRTNYASFANVPGASPQSAANFVAYLRGARSQEQAAHGPYRTRNYLLGDIVDSRPAVVAAPQSPYHDDRNPGYSAFASAYASRRPVVFVGANDGMLHAFDGSSTGTTAGRELFAYIPSFVYGDAANAATSGLAALGNPAFSHHDYVDATPQVFDVDLARTGGSAAGGGNWHSLLIGGLGKGGRGYYAIDVTDPLSWTGESDVAKKVLWEFTDPRMGYSYGAASVVKTRKYGWVAVLTSGYDNADGRGWFFFVNPANGTLLEAVSTPAGSLAAPLDMAQLTAYIPDYGDFTADAIYAADMQGNVWRLDVSGTGAYVSPTRIARLTDSNGTPQPVTTRPLVEADPVTGRRYVLVGTGRLLGDSDINSSQVQSFYAFVDGKAGFGAFFGSGGPGASFPFTRGDLKNNADLLAGLGSADNSPLGWYFDLAVPGGIAERINVQPTANNGIVAFAANKPSGNTCDPAGTGRVFAIAMATGRTVLTADDSSTSPLIAATASGPLIRDLVFQRVHGKLRLYSGNSNGQVLKVPAALGRTASLKQLSWRELRPTE
jgi:type IV pilus assembly protein PilY1